jgi:uncharacterized protein (DUF2062 family)
MGDHHARPFDSLLDPRRRAPDGGARMSYPPQAKRTIPARARAWAGEVIRKNTPTREEMAQNKYLAPIAHRFLPPQLWRFTRRSVPRGVALGLFAAFIIPIGQIFLSAVMALPLRANVPLAALLTFVTNPFTLPFWAPIAYKTGDFLLRVDSAAPVIATAKTSSGVWAVLVDAWHVAGATVVGYFVLSLVTPVIGYVVSGWVWRAVVARKRTRRLKAMAARLDQRLSAH